MKKRILAAITTSCLVGSLTTLTGASGATPTSLKGLTGAQIEAVALAQMRAAGSYMVTVKSAFKGVNATSVTYSTLTSGIRHDVINGQRGERLMANGVVFVNFSTALEKIYFGKIIPTLANKWVAFKRGQPYYSFFASTMTEKTLAPILSLSGVLRVSAPLTYDAQRVVRITPVPKVSSSASGLVEDLYVANTAPFLPVALVIGAHSSTSTKTIETVTFKNWGTKVAVSAPSQSTPSSSFKLP